MISDRYQVVMSMQEWGSWGKVWWIEWQNMTKAWTDQGQVRFWGAVDF